MHTKQWHVDLFLEEDADVTRARAVLTTDGPNPLTGTGTARRNPRDPSVPEIGDELSAARALESLARRLLDVSYEDIDEMSPGTFRAD